MHSTLSVSSLLILAISALSIALMLVRPRKIPEVYWVASGALLLIVFRLISVELAGRAVAKGTDVYLFLIGMMLLSALARESGIFEWIASVTVQAAQGSGQRLFLLIYAAGTLVTIGLSNDATAVVLTPAVLAAVRHSQAQPVPFLFACAMIANAASFVLPISNPANLVVFHAGMPPVGQWLLFFLLPSVLSIVVTFFVLRWYFRKDLEQTVSVPPHKAKLQTPGKFVLAGLVLIVILLLVLSARHVDLGAPTCLAALCLTGLVCVRNQSNPWPFVKEISWATLGLVAALFVLVGAVETTGVLKTGETVLQHAQALGPVTGALLTALTVAVANNLINNLPLGLIAGSTLADTHTHGLFSHAVLIGVDLGPNLSVTGSLATILWLLALRREGLDVSALDFLKVGVIAMPLALLAAMAGACAMNFFVPVH